MKDSYIWMVGSRWQSDDENKLGNKCHHMQQIGPSPEFLLLTRNLWLCLCLLLPLVLAPFLGHEFIFGLLERWGDGKEKKERRETDVFRELKLFYEVGKWLCKWGKWNIQLQMIANYRQLPNIKKQVQNKRESKMQQPIAISSFSLIHFNSNPCSMLHKWLHSYQKQTDDNK